MDRPDPYAARALTLQPRRDDSEFSDRPVLRLAADPLLDEPEWGIGENADLVPGFEEIVGEPEHPVFFRPPV